MVNRFIILFGTILVLSACAPEVSDEIGNALVDIPKGFPEVEFPEDNQLNEARWSLGKKLFYETALSKDSSINCASCHKPELAFSDDKAFSLGVGGALGTRNSPSLANVAYHPYFTREGGVPTLEQQILVPIQEHNEFNTNIVVIGERLSQDSNYIKLANEAYGQDPNPFVITRALATFERSLISGNSAFDQFSQGDLSAMTLKEKQGMELFFSEKTNCSQCHSGHNFTNYSFENNGLYVEYNDIGRMRLTDNKDDLALFKVPSLRNVNVTGPYMHDGSIKTLRDVVNHYNDGGKGHVHQSRLIKPMNLSEEDQESLVSFLETLTDDHFIKNEIFK